MTHLMGLNDLKKPGFQSFLGLNSLPTFKTILFTHSPILLILSPPHSKTGQRAGKKRNSRVHQMIARLNELGFPLTLDEVLQLRGERGEHAIGRPHLANLMLQKGYVKSREEAFRTWLGEKGRAYVPSTYPESEEVIERIHQEKGLAILAHPHLLPRGKIRKGVLNLPLDGLEGRYARMRPDQNEPWIREGKKRGWIVTGGSDFHGSHRPDISFGSAWTDESTFKMLLAKYMTNKPV